MLTQLVGNLPSSSFHLSSISLSHFAPASLISIYHQAKALLSSLSFTLCFTLPLASVYLSPCRLPFCSPSPPPHHSLPLSFTEDLGSHSLSLPFMKLLMLFPAPLPSLPTHPLCAQLSLVTLSGCILSPQIVPVWPNPPPSKHTAQWPVLLKKQKFIPRVIFSDSTTSP